MSASPYSGIKRIHISYPVKYQEKARFSFLIDFLLGGNLVMEELISRFSHLGERILDSLDDKSLINCKMTGRTWNSFIENQKFPWIRKSKNQTKIIPYVP